MRKFAVIAFSDEDRTYQGLDALEELHAEGSLRVHGAEVIQRGADGAVSVLRPDDRAGLGAGLAALVGGLVGAIGGPVSLAVGLGVGAAAGGTRDLARAGVTRAFVTEIERTLAPGTLAVVSDLSEEWLVPLDTRMEALGAKVVREDRRTFEADLFDEHVTVPGRAAFDELKADLAALKERRAGAKAEELLDKLLTDGVEEERWRLETVAAAADDLLAHARRELDARMDALLARASQTTPELRERVRDRITALRAELAEREQKLRRAQELAREALQSST